MAIQNVTDGYIIPQAAGDTYNGDSSDQTYSINPALIGTGEKITIVDQGGTNSIELVGGLEIASTKVVSSQVQITLTNGAVIDIRGADTFTFKTGQNLASGDTTGTDRDFSNFAQDVLGVTVPAAGADAVDGGAVTVEGGDTDTDTGNDSSSSLTTGIDDIKAGSGDTTITALQTGVGETETFQAFDSIDGGDGTDTLNITNTEAAALNAAIVENVEVINYRSTAAGANIDMSNFTGETELTMDRTASSADVTDLELATELTLSGLREAANSTFTYLATDVTGTADAGAVTLDGVNDGAEVDFAGGIETFTVTTSGTDSRLDNFVLPNSVTGLTVNAAVGFRVDDIFTADEVETLTITGAGDVRIDPAQDDSTTTVDASASTGNVTLTMGVADQTITTNTGDDVIDMQGNLDRNDTIDLGDGSDTLRIDALGLTAGTFDLSISNVETFRFDDMEDTNGAINMDNLSVTSITMDGEAGGGADTNDGVLTLTDLATAVTTFDFVADGDASEDIAFNGLIADYDVAGTTNVSSITVNVNNGGVTADDMFLDRIEGDNIEELQIVAADIGQDATDELTIADIDGMNDLTSISVVADGEVVISNIDAATDDSLEVLDLSGITAGGATISTILGHANGLTITGSGFDDTIVNGNDDGGEVSVDLGAGNDAYTSADATDTITTGTGSDTITFQGDAADDDNVITDFTAGNGGDIIDFAANNSDTAGGTTLTNLAEFATSGDYDAGAAAVGMVVLGENIGGNTENDVATLFGADDAFFAGATTDAFYLAVDDGTDTNIFFVESGGANQLFTAAEDTATLITTLTGVSDATSLNANNFADFL